MNVLISVRRTSVDDLHFLEVNEDATCHGIVSLVVILGCRENLPARREVSDKDSIDGLQMRRKSTYRENPGSLRNSDSFSVGFVCTHDVRKSLEDARNSESGVGKK